MRRAVKRVAVVGLAAALCIGSGCSVLRQTIPGLGGGEHGRALSIAILPFAYRDASGGLPCDLCPDRLVMAPTSQDEALLVTAFFYESLESHPRLSVMPEETVSRFFNGSLARAAERLRAQGGVDAVLVGGLLELRRRVGDPRAPERRAGAAVYAALLDLSDGEVLWKAFYDRDDRPSGRLRRQVGRFIGQERDLGRTAVEVAHEEAVEMVSELVDRVR